MILRFLDCLGPKLTYSTPIAAINPLPAVPAVHSAGKDYKKLNMTLPAE